MEERERDGDSTSSRFTIPGTLSVRLREILYYIRCTIHTYKRIFIREDENYVSPIYISAALLNCTSETKSIHSAKIFNTIVKNTV